MKNTPFLLLITLWTIFGLSPIRAQSPSTTSSPSPSTVLSEDGARDVARAQFPNCRIVKSTLSSNGGKSVWSVAVEADKIAGSSKRPKTKKEFCTVVIDAQSQSVLSKKKSSSIWAH